MFQNELCDCKCGRPRMEGHFTCGDAACGTQAEAEAELRARVTVKVATGAARLFRRECVLCGSASHRTSECPEWKET